MLTDFCFRLTNHARQAVPLRHGAELSSMYPEVLETLVVVCEKMWWQQAAEPHARRILFPRFTVLIYQGIAASGITNAKILKNYLFLGLG